MNLRKIFGCFTAAVAVLALGACSTGGGAWKPTLKNNKLDSDSLYVEKVDNLSDDFIKGMDVSSLLSEEASGVQYYDYDGNVTDCLKVMADAGINYVRVRVWNDPKDSSGNGYGGGNCDIDTAVEIGKRAAKYGMKMLVDFHYSDFWADPNKQMCPKAWVGMTADEKASACYDYTVECLQKLKDAGVSVGMVQVGNETNGGKIAGETTWLNCYKIMDAGSRATRKVFPGALVAVHFANPEKTTNYENYASKLAYYELDYDVFASSYYPYWHGTLENLTNILSEIATTYNKKVMVAETSYCYTSEDTDYYANTISSGSGIVKDYPFTVEGQATSVRNVIEAVSNATNGIGVFYWEGAWISVGTNSWEENSAKWEKYGSGWASSYSTDYDPDDAGKYYGGCAVDNQAFFDATGHPLESLKVWGLVNGGNKTEVVADAIEDTTLIIDLNDDIVLPTTVNAVMTDGSKSALEVTWTDADIPAMKAGGVAKYTIHGTAGGMDATCYVSMIEYNFLTNYSFESGEEGWTCTMNSSGMDELYAEQKSTNALTGDYTYHFWSEKSNTVNFDLEQKVSLKAGYYKFTGNIMGGDGGETNIYIYVKINGEVKYTKAMTITSWNSWDSEVIKNIVVSDGDEVVVGIHVECAGSGSGAWGNIDDMLLNSQSELEEE